MYGSNGGARLFQLPASRFYLIENLNQIHINLKLKTSDLNKRYRFVNATKEYQNTLKVKLTLYNLDDERKNIKQKMRGAPPAPHVSHTRIEF